MYTFMFWMVYYQHTNWKASGFCKNEITYPFPNSSGTTVDVWEWTRNFTWHVLGHVITHPCISNLLNHTTTITEPENFNMHIKHVLFSHQNCGHMGENSHKFRCWFLCLWIIIWANVAVSLPIFTRTTKTCHHHISHPHRPHSAINSLNCDKIFIQNNLMWYDLRCTSEVYDLRIWFTVALRLYFWVPSISVKFTHT